MSEDKEGGSPANFKRTEMVQQKKMEKIESHGWRAALTGSGISAAVNSKYEAGKGGFVNTSINTVDALLNQQWEFDEKDELTKVVIKKELLGTWSSAPVSEVVLERDSDGRFRLTKSETASTASEWNKRFNLVRDRIKSKQKIPTKV